MITRVPRPRERAEPREISELRALAREQPELAPAVDLQIELLDIQRRVMPRISLPAALLGPAFARVRPDGRPMLTWEYLPLEWSDFRAVLRETTDALLRSGNIERADAEFLTAITRDGNRLPIVTEAWFRVRIEGASIAQDVLADVARAYEGVFDTALALAMRPFLVRCAEAVAPRLALDDWQRGSCPLCGGDPDLAVVSQTADRTLVCGRCSLRWPYADQRCPFCENTDPDRLRSFASPSRRHRLFACDACSRYVKAYDERFGTRPALPSVDAIATLPLDAVALQRGYQG